MFCACARAGTREHVTWRTKLNAVEMKAEGSGWGGGKLIRVDKAAGWILNPVQCGVTRPRRVITQPPLRHREGSRTLAHATKVEREEGGKKKREENNLMAKTQTGVQGRNPSGSMCRG